MRPSNLAVVTGASKGIGAAVARTLSEHGFAVLLIARDAQALSQVAGYIQAEGGTAFAVAADLTRPEQADDVLRAVRQTGLELKIVVHNAGMARVAPVAQMALKDWEDLIRLNLTAPFVLTQKLLPLLRYGSQIIFINSIGGRQAFPEWSAYCASKFGLRAFADSL
ncbi:MAG TPA: SDR family NAD(P)-dependent oxidoreductase, partial [Caldithrix abyssi]|nr:SDR family NAD(P)-dependent oxidoreductase [Caldithrix abyssi]